MSGLVFGLILGAASSVAADDQNKSLTGQEACDPAYCRYLEDQSSPDMQTALKGFPNYRRPSFVNPETVQIDAQNKCVSHTCSQVYPKPIAGQRYRVESGNTVLNTVLGGAVGALAGGNALDTPGAIGFGLLGATLGNRDASLEKNELTEKRERAIRARERTLNNFNDMVFDPSAPIPIDAHYLGDRRKKNKK